MCTTCVIKGLEEFMEAATLGIQSNGFLKLSIPSIPLCSIDSHVNSRPLQRRRARGRELKFPGRSFNDSQSSIIMLRVVRLILENLQAGTNITTRDIYYQDVDLFRTQLKVSGAIERLCLNTGVPRSLFRIMPSPKGLIVADLEVTLVEGSEGQSTRATIKRCNGPSLIPVGQEIIDMRVPRGAKRPEFVLIVEKEGVFTHLYPALPQAILITGKGFPDHYTRKFLYAIEMNFPSLPIYGLVDSDVHGMHILRTYQDSGENTLEFHYPLENLQFLGVSIYDFGDGWVDITAREYRMGMTMLNKSWIRDAAHASWRREVQRQLFMGKKVEMNILDRSHLTTLVDYIQEKVGGARPPPRIKAKSKPSESLWVKPAREMPPPVESPQATQADPDQEQQGVLGFSKEYTLRRSLRRAAQEWAAESISSSPVDLGGEPASMDENEVTIIDSDPVTPQFRRSKRLRSFYDVPA